MQVKPFQGRLSWQGNRKWRKDGRQIYSFVHTYHFSLPSFFLNSNIFSLSFIGDVSYLILPFLPPFKSPSNNCSPRSLLPIISFTASKFILSLLLLIPKVELWPFPTSRYQFFLLFIFSSSSKISPHIYLLNFTQVNGFSSIADLAICFPTFYLQFSGHCPP